MSGPPMIIILLSGPIVAKAKLLLDELELLVERYQSIYLVGEELQVVER